MSVTVESPGCLRQSAANWAAGRASALGVFAATGRIVYRGKLVAEIEACRRSVAACPAAFPADAAATLTALACHAECCDRSTSPVAVAAHA